MPQILQLTDGSTTLNLMDGTNYAVQGGGWQLAVASPTSLSNNYYDQITETLAINVYGSTAPVLYANMTALLKLLQQAERWAQQLSTESPVRLRYQPVSSGIGGVLECLCFGRAQDDQAVSVGVFDMGGTVRVLPITIRIQRRALWLTVTPTTATITTNNQPTWAAYTATFSAAAPTLSPTNISLVLASPNTYCGFGGTQYLAVAPTGDMSSVSAAVLNGTNFSFVTSAAFPAIGTVVLKYIAAAAQTGTTSSTIPLPTTAPSNVYDVFFSGRPDITTNIWVSTDGGATPLNTVFSWTNITTLSTNYMGRIILPGNGGTTAIYLTVQTSAAGNVLIDRIVFVRNSAETAILQTTLTSGGVLAPTSGNPFGVAMNPLSSLLPSILPSAGTTATGTTAMMTRSAAIQVVWMANDPLNGYSVDASTSASGTKVQAQFTVTVTRNNAYLTPE